MNLTLSGSKLSNFTFFKVTILPVSVSPNTDPRTARTLELPPNAEEELEADELGEFQEIRRESAADAGEELEVDELGEFLEIRRESAADSLLFELDPRDVAAK